MSSKPAPVSVPAVEKKSTPAPVEHHEKKHHHNITTALAGAPSVSFRILDSLSTPFFDDDYPHAKAFFTTKYKGVGEKFIVNGKGVVVNDIKTTTTPAKEGENAPTESHSESWKSSGEVKLVTRLNDYSVTEAKFDNKGGVKFWSNWGTHDIGKNVNLWTKVKTSTDFTFFSAWVAA